MGTPRTPPLIKSIEVKKREIIEEILPRPFLDK